MKIDVLIAEIGSTTTLVNAFMLSPEPCFINQGSALTTVLEGDVNLGLNNAILDLKTKLGEDLEIKEVLATSSAAGGLKMTVHGLVYDMTVKAAKEAALGAGANIHLVTSGKLTQFDINKILRIKPNIILIAGGVDHGEKNTALNNAYEIAKLAQNVPVIYAGNCDNIDEIKEIFKEHNQSDYLHITENVYPQIDELNVEPTRKIIQDVFEKHIIHAPGMNTVYDTVDRIIPTPGAVMLCAKLLETEIGDLVVFDVGGATTDLHSVTDGSSDVNRILINPEPKAKRTVEGDLGVYINRNNLIDMIGLDKLANELDLPLNELRDILDHYQVIPKGNQVKLVERLTKEAITKALERHCGRFRNIFGQQGRITMAEGKDLTNVRYVIGTGGALTRLPNSKKIMRQVLENQDHIQLMPPKNAEILIDHDYLMASLGVLSLVYPKETLTLLKRSLRIE